MASCVLLFACGGGSATTSGNASTSTGSDTTAAKKNDGPGENTGAETGNDNSGTDSTTTDDSGAETGGGKSSTNTTSTKTTVNNAATVKKPGRVVAKRARRKPVKTTKPIEKMTAFLVKPVQRALKRKQLGIAIPLLQGLVAARGEGDEYNYKLGIAWSDQGNYDRAVSVLDGFIRATDNELLRGRATRARDNLARVENPFAKQFRPSRLSRRYATMAFRKGRAAFKRKHYGDALIYYRTGAAIDPLAGFMRELGATYDKLGMKREKVKFYYRYLRRRPFGKNANMVRKALRKSKGLLSPLTIKSALKCQELWINGQRVTRAKLPMKNVLVAPGKYRGLCINYKYNFGMFENSYVKQGKRGVLEFRWAILVNGLKNPLGRIQLEDARTKQMRNLALVPKTVGVVVPRNGRALKLVKTSLNRAKTRTQYIKLQPGQKYVVKW